MISGAVRGIILGLPLITGRLIAAENVPGTVSRFDAPLSAPERKLSAIGGNPPETTAKCAIALPAGFDPRKEAPLLIWTSPQNSRAVDSMSDVAKTITDSGWVALAADGSNHARVETTEWCVSMLMAAFDRLERSWPSVRRCPMAIGGFSGGAKRSAYMAAMLMEQRHPLVGMYWGGCNEDRGTDALRWHKPGVAYYLVRIALSTGTRDSLVTAERAAKVVNSLNASGFTNVRQFPYEGEHALDRETLRQALAWFNSPQK